MADIVSVGRNSIGPMERTAPAKGRTAPPTPTTRDSQPRSSDSLELSQHARFLNQLREIPEVREDRVDEIRSAIADGTYETGGKVDQAIDRLLEDILSS